MPQIRVEKVHGPASRAILKGLRAFTGAAVGKKVVHTPLTITLNERGKIVGGLTGDSFFDWMFVKFFWISDEHRGKGHGRKMMKLVEDEARKRGLTGVYLDTFSFQAPKLYAKLGYKEFGRLEEYPAGQYRVWMRKVLRGRA